MMISKKMNGKLNEQIAAEFAAAYRYLAMSCTLDRMGLRVLRDRLVMQYHEEVEHAMKILRYIQEVGGAVVLDAQEKPAGEFKSAEAIVQAALDGEIEITNRIHALMSLAETEKDYATRSFLQWFVDEQVEEVASMTDMLNLLKLAGGNVLQVEARIMMSMKKD